VTADRNTATEVIPAFVPPFNRAEAARRRLQSLPWLPGLIGAVLLIGLGQTLSPGFASWSNINQILAGAAILAIASTGQTLVMISGNFGIDLSVGEVISLTAVVGYTMLKGGNKDLPLALAAVLIIGAAFGLVNGTLVAFARLPALVVTLGTLVIAEGAIQAIASQGTPAGSVPGMLLDLTTSGVGGIKYVTLLGAVFIIGMIFFVRYSGYGRRLFLAGSSREAARLSGLPVRRVVISTFVIAGMCSGFAGLLLLSYAGTANLDLGGNYLLLSIAAAVIGGTSLAGGEGSVIGAATGAVTFVAISELISTLGASSAIQQIVIGALLMALLAFNGRIPKLRQ
jgi:ribose transport system permease protein